MANSTSTQPFSGEYKKSYIFMSRSVRNKTGILVAWAEKIDREKNFNSMFMILIIIVS